MNKFFIILVGCLLSLAVHAQSGITVSKKDNGQTVYALVEEYANDSVQFFFSDEYAKQVEVSVIQDSMLLMEVLSNSLKSEGYYIVSDDLGNYFITKTNVESIDISTQFGLDKPAEDIDVSATSTFLQTNKSNGVSILTVGNRKAGAYQNSVNIKGRVVNGENGEPLFGASLFIEELKTGASTGPDGTFSLTLDKGTYSLTVKSLEAEERKFKLKVFSDDEILIELNSKIFSLNEVVVSAEAKANVERVTMGVEKLNTKTVKGIPQIMGENDIVKAAMLLPGVQSVGEGTGGFNVRGAPADQNIFYLNGIPVYNTSHLLGFFSAFTPSVIGDFSLYKGAFPAYYGGRLSSVFDITTKSASKEPFLVRAGVSPVTADVMVEGTVANNRLKYVVGTRTTYSNWVMRLVKSPELQNSAGSFADGVVDLDYQISAGQHIQLTAYGSNDFINLNGLTEFNYQNLGGALNYRKTINQKHSFKASITNGQYYYNEDNFTTDYAHYHLAYDLNHTEAKLSITLNPNYAHSVTIGASSVLYNVDQGELSPIGEASLYKNISFIKEQGLESALFINEEWKAGARFSFQAGGRLNLYQYLGPNTVYQYLDNVEKTANTIVDTSYYAANEVIQKYLNPDVRLSARYSINEFFSLKASVNRMHQYINMLTNTVAISPNAKWKLADTHIKPLSGWQYSLGVFKNFKYNTYELSLEVYYKQVDQLLDFKDGSDLVVTTLPETNVLQGNLDAYGAELMLKKTRGSLTGWLNYTYSRSLVFVPGINNDLTYPANFDKPHAVNVVANYKFSRRLSMSGNFVYTSGRPVTYPTAAFYQNEAPYIHFSARNEFRIPSYIRLDLGFNLEGNLKAKKLFHGTWNFSLYNLLGRNNAFTVYATQEGNSIQGYQLSIFGSAIPSISYKLKLGAYEK